VLNVIPVLVLSLQRHHVAAESRVRVRKPVASAQVMQGELCTGDLKHTALERADNERRQLLSCTCYRSGAANDEKEAGGSAAAAISITS
jgi:hypothetical protein